MPYRLIRVNMMEIRKPRMKVNAFCLIRTAMTNRGTNMWDLHVKDVHCCSIPECPDVNQSSHNVCPGLSVSSIATSHYADKNHTFLCNEILLDLNYGRETLMNSSH